DPTHLVRQKLCSVFKGLPSCQTQLLNIIIPSILCQELLSKQVMEEAISYNLRDSFIMLTNQQFIVNNYFEEIS
ncbi:MAG: hypothetical protein ACLRX6_07305, partial [Limosilactobacillus pontis]|uniref:hypothetical protein n=1 Tax=Limosilactobacillus pontis TaxID=35787 RepID=UPI00399FDD7F